MNFQLGNVRSGENLEFEARSLIVAGFTGRNPSVVAAHVEELGRLGIPQPAETPVLYPLPAALLTTSDAIVVSNTQTSGEVEPVLFWRHDASYLGVGSDHTDRDLERIDISRGKAACPKVIGTEVVDYEVALQHWSDLRLRARTGVSGELYQEGSAGELLSIPELLSFMRERGYLLEDGTIVFLGTLPLRTETFVYSDRWSVELTVPDGPTLTCSYDVEVAMQPEVMT